MKKLLQFLRSIWKAGVFSPTSFVVRALLLSLAFAASELLGFRDYTTFLSGTSANPNLSWRTGATLGFIHLLLYVAFILVVPIFLIAASLLAIWNRRKTAETRVHGNDAPAPRQLLGLAAPSEG
jgi:hypothetical protein